MHQNPATMIPRIVSALTLCILSPLLLVVATAIALSDGRPILFAQNRLGLARSPFIIYKFRTMSDNHVTRLGRLLRASGLDELPQLWHIMTGEMSFVGPRPLTSADVLRLGWSDKYYDARWSVRPGITGLAQLSPHCHRKITWMYDRYYAHHYAQRLDLSILLRSAFIPIIGKHCGKRIARIFQKKPSR